jgi:hypothetical protein
VKNLPFEGASFMKKLVLFIALFSQMLFAQQNDLQVDLQPVSGSDVNWETTLTLDAEPGMENGLLVEIPAGIKMVPLSARLNDNIYYLQNKSELPENESVINWELSEEGIILFFPQGAYNAGDRLILKTMTTKIKKRLDDNQRINIRIIDNIIPEIQFSEDIKVSNSISLQTED